MESADLSNPQATTAQSAPFIARWQGREGGQERANYALFLTELCDAIGVARPDPASASTEQNDYVFERAVTDPAPGPYATRFMDFCITVRRLKRLNIASFSLPAGRIRPTTFYFDAISKVVDGRP